MNFEDYQESLKETSPPENVTGLLQALWWEKKGDWDKAHTIAQDIDSADAAWVHAYLHRREGDEGNAGYWYSRAGKPKSDASLDEEWEEITKTFLKENT